MKLGLHTYSLNLHGIGQDWAGFKWPWPRQISTFELMDMVLDLDLEGIHLDDGVLERLDPGFLTEVGAEAARKQLYLEYNFSMDMGGQGIGIQHDLPGALDTVNALHVTEDPMTAIRNLAPRAFTNHFRDDRIEFQRWGFKLVGTAVGEGDIDMKTAYELFRDQSSMARINIETEMDTPLDDMERALAMEVDAVRRSVTYCREVLGIRREVIQPHRQ